jgi:uncharacterized hydrophobic protein (TIGR00271 family)
MKQKNNGNGFLERLNRFAEKLESEKKFDNLIKEADNIKSYIETDFKEKPLEETEKNEFLETISALIDKIESIKITDEAALPKKSALIERLRELKTPLTKAPEKKPDKSTEVMESVEDDKKKIQRKNFLGHLFKKGRDGDFSFFKNGVGGVIKEYRDFHKAKEETIKKAIAYETVVSGATDTIEYYVLLVLSCLIATFGLYLNSPAIIIGAMIVAPLMGPVFGFSAGMLWGSGKVIREAFFTLIKGSILVILISAALTYLIPGIYITSEIAARSKPTLFDIIVALCCGFVGAYAFVNKRVSSAVPGVAVSVALMPPVCTIGIGLGLLDFELVKGASLLYGVNVLCISLAALIVFYLIKLHPESDDKREFLRAQRRAIGHILVSILLLILIAAPLTYFMITSSRDKREQSIITDIISKNLPDTKIFSIDIKKDTGYEIETIALSAFSITNYAAIENEISETLGQKVRLNIYEITRIKNQAEN